MPYYILLICNIATLTIAIVPVSAALSIDVKFQDPLIQANLLRKKTVRPPPVPPRIVLIIISPIVPASSGLVIECLRYKHQLHTLSTSTCTYIYNTDDTKMKIVSLILPVHLH